MEISMARRVRLWTGSGGHRRSRWSGHLLAALLALLPAACGSSDGPAAADSPDAGPASDPARADYATVFPADRVIRLDVEISGEQWAAMMADLTDMAGPFGQGGGGPGRGGSRPPGGGGPIPDGGLPLPPPGGGGPVPDGGLPPPPPGGPDRGLGAEFFPRTPVYVPCTVRFEGQAWHNVGIRFKGNSSLSSTWRRGVYKLPFRLDFDELEDRFPEVAKQRFFGLKALSLANSFSDPTLIREKVMADLFRAGGVPAARTGFVRLHVDRGQGPEYFGLYALTEVPDKAMLRAQFGGDEGNLYRPQGVGAQLARFDQASFEKKTNKDAADYSDVMNLIAALNSDRSDAARWRGDLEATFDVPGFLKWLAINTLAGNWDVYGQMAHNYYLYGDPAQGGRLFWIPWDHDLSLQERPGGSDLLHTRTTATWPLIRYLLDDPEYRTRYLTELQTAVEGVLSPAAATDRFTRAHALIAPHVLGGGDDPGERPGFTFLTDPAAFHTALTTLNAFVGRQASGARDLLSTVAP
jgi:spore coat protein H